MHARPAADLDAVERRRAARAAGEDATTVAPDDYAGAPDEGSWNQADAAFVTGMIEHHLQALEIAALAPDRAGSDAVRSFAERVTAAQGPEVHALASWLQARGLAVPGRARRTRAGPARARPTVRATTTATVPPGCSRTSSSRRFEAASGPEFDRLFLEGMIQHHEGALAMVDVVLVEGEDLFANEMAAETAAGQGGEIDRMRGLLAQL